MLFGMVRWPPPSCRPDPLRPEVVDAVARSCIDSQAAVQQLHLCNVTIHTTQRTLKSYRVFNYMFWDVKVDTFNVNIQINLSCCMSTGPMGTVLVLVYCTLRALLLRLHVTAVTWVTRLTRLTSIRAAWTSLPLYSSETWVSEWAVFYVPTNTV